MCNEKLKRVFTYVTVESSSIGHGGKSLTINYNNNN